MEKQRSLIIFEESIKSENTKHVYLYLLEMFMRWAKVETFDDLLKADEKSIQRKVEDYVIHLKTKISPNSFSSQLSPIILFYKLNDVNLNEVSLKKMYPEKIKRGGYGAYTKQDVQTMLDSTASKRTKAIILILSSTGCRVGALVELKMKHIENMPHGCKSVLFYAGSVEEYIGFLTPESTKAVDAYFDERIQDNERITQESPVIRERYTLGSLPAKSPSHQLISETMNWATRRIKRQKTQTGRYNIPKIHGIRKYFNLTLKMRKDANLSLCEKLIGHSTTIPLDNYYLPAKKAELFEEFQKAIPELTISDTEKQKIEIDQQKKKITKLEAKDQEIEQLKARFESIELLIERITIAPNKK